MYDCKHGQHNYSIVDQIAIKLRNVQRISYKGLGRLFCVKLNDKNLFNAAHWECFDHLSWYKKSSQML